MNCRINNYKERIGTIGANFDYAIRSHCPEAAGMWEHFLQTRILVCKECGHVEWRRPFHDWKGLCEECLYGLEHLACADCEEQNCFYDREFECPGQNSRTLCPW
jgi:hypothetical protein